MVRIVLYCCKVQQEPLEHLLVHRNAAKHNFHSHEEKGRRWKKKQGVRNFAFDIYVDVGVGVICTRKEICHCKKYSPTHTVIDIVHFLQHIKTWCFILE